MISGILAPIFAFAVIVLVHEGGHFICAKLLGMEVREFAVGFGPKLWSVRKNGTLYSLRIIPLGGFNKIVGMDRAAAGNPRAFSSKPVWARLIVVAAGSVFNILFAFLLIAGAFWMKGYQTFSNVPVIGAVIADSSAEASGLTAGDRILSVYGIPIEKWTDIGPAFHDKGNTVVPLEIDRDGRYMSVQVIPRLNEEGRPVIGIIPSWETHKAELGESLWMSGEKCAELLEMMGKGLYSMIYGNTQDISGPIGVARMAGSAADAGFFSLVMFIALLSLNLGFLNLLPIPLLDGGVLLFTLLEGISGRKIPEKVLFYIQTAGIAILVGLFAFAMINDVTGLMK